MTTALRIETADTRGRTTALTVAGDLDLHTAPTLDHRVKEVLGDRSTVIVELTGITFCDSSGLNTLLRLRRRAQETGSQFVLAAPPPQMLRLLTITGAGRIFTIHGSLAEARQAHSRPGASPTG